MSELLSDLVVNIFLMAVLFHIFDRLKEDYMKEPSRFIWIGLAGLILTWWNF